MTDLDETADAAVEVIDCMRVLVKSGSNLVAEVLGGQDFIQFEHYPPDDVYDPETHAQYYFHAHPPGRGAFDDYGHFHTFLRPRGMPPGMARPADYGDAADDNAALSHLIAISMNREGHPTRLFTTNRWVTAESWYDAPQVIAMLDRFVVDLSRPSWPLNRWLSAMVVLYRPEIETLLHARDAAVADWRTKHPDSDVFEDRELEITSALDIDLEGRLAAQSERLSAARYVQ